MLGVELEDEFPKRTWRWFAVKVGYILNSDNPLARKFSKPEPVGDNSIQDGGDPGLD